MEPQTNSGQYSIVTLTALGVVMLVLSGGIGAIVSQTLFSKESQLPQIVRVSSPQPNIAYASTEGTVRSVSGVVVSLRGGIITMKLQNSSDVGALVTRDTKIVKTTMKDPQVFNSEMTDFMKKAKEVQNPEKLVLPPDQFTRTDAVASDISVGDSITVFAKEDIGDKKQFLVDKVEFYTPVK